MAGKKSRIRLEPSLELRIAALLSDIHHAIEATAGADFHPGVRSHLIAAQAQLYGADTACTGGRYVWKTTP